MLRIVPFWLVLFVSSLQSRSATNPIGMTDCGPVKGVYLDDIDPEIANFRSIRYARPPLQENRWRPSVTLKAANQCWRGTYDATTWRAFCPQKLSGSVMGDEDCLFLNIWVKNISAPLRPVTMYIHGGDLTMGMGNDAFGELPWRLARDKNIVAVTINYRLNALGFLTLDSLSGRSGQYLKGNYGFQDQITALRWIQNNIANFGGDPTKVTIYGQSSGGTSVFALLISPLAKGLFSSAISMSGSPQLSATLSETESIQATTWLANNRCAHNNTLSCLYSLTKEEVVSSLSILWDDTDPSSVFGIPFPGAYQAPLAVVDGEVIPHDLYTSLSNASLHNDVPLVVGDVREETDFKPNDIVLYNTTSEYIAFLSNKFSKFSPGFASQVIKQYPFGNFETFQQHYDQVSADIHFICPNIKLAMLTAQGSLSPIYSYVATHAPSNVYCFPGFDNGYCSRYSFHLWDLFAMNYNYIPFFNMTDVDLQFGNILLDALADLGQTGRIDNWATINGHSPHDYNVNIIDTVHSVTSSYKSKQCQFWHENGFDQFALIN